MELIKEFRCWWGLREYRSNHFYNFSFLFFFITTIFIFYVALRDYNSPLAVVVSDPLTFLILATAVSFFVFGVSMPVNRNSNYKIAIHYATNEFAKNRHNLPDQFNVLVSATQNVRDGKKLNDWVDNYIEWEFTKKELESLDEKKIELQEKIIKLRENFAV